MKTLKMLLASTILLVGLPAINASEMANASCKDTLTASECKAYIAGVVEGYIASKKKYLEKQTGFENGYANRAYLNRVGNSRVSTSKETPACLPDNLDANEIIEVLATEITVNNITDDLGNYLRKTYPCVSSK